MDGLFEFKDDLRAKLLEMAGFRLGQAESHDQIIEIVRGIARGITLADGVTFVLREQSLCHYVEEDAIRPLWKGQKFPMTSCISGWAMMNGKTAVIPDVFADPRIPHDIYRKTFVKSLVMAPVGWDSPVAAIGVYWRDKSIIRAREVAIIEKIAAMIGDAMRRTRAAA
ncbi:MAG TPA: GAF domain-containing protein [Rhizomicrobium sp.]|nr:GAF domain-containing protein [Rhizomicrobium sp.]